jgi:CRP/FNR family transcriptional regulator, cyclic AMP receptor protein
MTRALHKPSASISIDALLSDSPWFAQIGDAARRQVRADIVERAIAAGESLGHQDETQHHWYGVLEGLLKWSINARDGRTVTLGGQSVGSWFGEGTLLRQRPRHAELVALRHGRVAMLPFETFDWLRRTQAPFKSSCCARSTNGCTGSWATSPRIACSTPTGSSPAPWPASCTRC